MRHNYGVAVISKFIPGESIWHIKIVNDKQAHRYLFFIIDIGCIKWIRIIGMPYKSLFCNSCSNSTVA